MSFKCGIVGLPNVGKSTLFNVITDTSIAQSANYPFCTIEPNKASVAVPDSRLVKLASIAGSDKIIPDSIEIIDIAGLVRGASKGDGLGNQFLENIRQVNAIIHVVRCFDDGGVVHVEESIDPMRDIEIIETELLLADISRLDKHIDFLQKKVNSKDPDAIFESELAKQLLKEANNGRLLSSVPLTDIEFLVVSKMHLLTMKPVMYVANISDDSTKNVLLPTILDLGRSRNIPVIEICVAMEADMIGLNEEEKLLLLEDFSLDRTALSQLISSAYKLLNLLTFFTVGPKEARAWSVKSGSFAPKAAGVIHTDFEHGFIKAETVSYDDFINYSGEKGARDAGRFRIEGKEYQVSEGDIFHFRFNV